MKKMNNKKFGFRAWFYFRTGWTTYFAFIFSTINTLVVTYYLAIDNIPVLKEIFPSFTHYVLTIGIIGVPILIIVGYVHFKRSGAFKSEADITMESNPHLKRILLNTEVLLSLQIRMNHLITKMINNEELSRDELKELEQLKLKLNEHLKNRTISDKNIE